MDPRSRLLERFAEKISLGGDLKRTIKKSLSKFLLMSGTGSNERSEAFMSRQHNLGGKSGRGAREKKPFGWRLANRSFQERHSQKAPSWSIREEVPDENGRFRLQVKNTCGRKKELRRDFPVGL